MKTPSLCNHQTTMSSRIPSADLVAMPEVPHPIPFRTRSLSPPGPMVLRLKARESRSPPGPPKGYKTNCKSPETDPYLTTSPAIAAGWSSPVARQAHNLKVAGSNPAPAPKSPKQHNKPAKQKCKAGFLRSGQRQSHAGLGQALLAAGARGGVWPQGQRVALSSVPDHPGALNPDSPSGQDA
jgi:hypothetical protein